MSESTHGLDLAVGHGAAVTKFEIDGAGAGIADRIDLVKHQVGGANLGVACGGVDLEGERLVLADTIGWRPLKVVTASSQRARLDGVDHRA